MNENDGRIARARNWKLLARLSPGKGKTVAATRGSDGQIHTLPEDIAKDLREHWKPIFTAKPTDGGLRVQWMKDELDSHTSQLPPPTSPGWRIQVQDVRTAIQCAGSACPGPDGIPARA